MIVVVVIKYSGSLGDRKEGINRWMVLGYVVVVALWELGQGGVVGNGTCVSWLLWDAGMYWIACKGKEKLMSNIE